MGKISKLISGAWVKPIKSLNSRINESLNSMTLHLTNPSHFQQRIHLQLILISNPMQSTMQGTLQHQFHTTGRKLLMKFQIKMLNKQLFYLYQLRLQQNTVPYPANIYLYKVNNTNTRKRPKIGSKLRIKTPFSSASIVSFEK